MKIILILFLIWLGSKMFAQTNPNLVPNGSFELSGVAPSFSTNDFNSDVTWWDLAQYDGDNCINEHGSGLHPCGIADYVSIMTDNAYNTSNSCSSPSYPSNRFVGLSSGSVGHTVPPGYCHHSQGIRVQLIKDGIPYSLIKGHTYKLKVKLRLGSISGSNLFDNLRVHFSYFGENWNANPNLSINRKWSNATSFQYSPSDFDPCVWYSFERVFVVPRGDCDGNGGCDYLQNMILFLDDNDSDEISASLYIDDVELYDEGCCIPYKQYENTSDLPQLTHT